MNRTLVCMALLLLVSNATAGLFIDVGLAASLQQWPQSQQQNLGSSPPLGCIGFGYWNQLNDTIMLHAGIEHISSIPDNNDHGLNIVKVGIRLESK